MSPRRTTQKSPIIFIILALIISIALAFFIFFNNAKTSTPPPVHNPIPQELTDLPADSETDIKSPKTSNLSKISNDSITIKDTQGDQKTITNIDITAIDTTIAPKPLTSENATNKLAKLFQELDNKEYIKKILDDGTSKERFTKILQKLMKSPPIIAGESDDLYNLLQNTAHFFRTLGGENIRLLKLIINNESNRIENIAASIFPIINDNESLSKEFDIKNNNSAIYEYGCFFLNTMGGRLYVFRRNTELRMIINYYSLSVVAEAELNGLNNHGVDIRLHLRNLIREMEEYGQKLVFRDIYLQKLYNLEKDFQ